MFLRHSLSIGRRNYVIGRGDRAPTSMFVDHDYGMDVVWHSNVGVYRDVSVRTGREV